MDTTRTVQARRGYKYYVISGPEDEDPIAAGRQPGIDQFSEEVKYFLNGGWNLTGGVGIDADGRMLQAVYRDTEG